MAELAVDSCTHVWLVFVESSHLLVQNVAATYKLELLLLWVKSSHELREVFHKVC